ncbi:bifunctional [glutamate--ammonia ligase]-adenylyl-L-tyrosine phosphorylase/[glutamate--ammonia-ligase] adenylyltransferase [Niveibacterium sp. 24ML]|uniref:bifunctional [glutamate--ammonia ligase]-adenylyl-L-tyrosine phosphorylase/[glutamate--ammonia-ligase] adenylyltransferase n=1 Tax=Niveibacterium sp. 24ML TaxID=2985512 RepID=UPI00226FD849|nr:bifunctional [glutamate--ammonia ligase]-adenylyl-L-tyrosine phosphorylase/[glutamate--ammonia-ligase] adenylyltransferase [Niveibacterium sp. 24ML]MCX9157645.1 bifunctional [glutamate--ammonia ligase]-adenylyl-L-tyrosine phosphorylase/[glutamate--ammonia-ligase] adenylyltransferase [Niveibacterium sp. 24ML]
METVAQLTERLAPALAASRYLQRELNARAWLADLLASSIDAPLSANAMRDFLACEAPDEAQLKRGLRRLRTWVICHTAARDLLGLAPLSEVTEAMTRLAEVSIAHAHELLHATLAARHGAPAGSDGSPMHLIIIGMGKLGGRELNVSSDIDLIFVYPEDGETSGARPLSHFEFFTRLGRQIIAAIGEVTEDGFVFRVDMRLRPNGDSGPLVSSFDALEHYFIAQGREWERFAWIKARALSGSRHDELAAIVRPFVFRKYLDFGAINALRALHTQIRAQVARREMATNIKLGPGGIREIEFTAQVFQIIRGGRDIGLQIKPTLPVLEALADRGVLDFDAVAAMEEAYVFLRRLEHRLQYLDDAQTHDLPATPEDRQRIAVAMGFADEAAMLAELERHRRIVGVAFQAACGDPNEAEHALDELWDAGITPEHVATRFEAMGFKNATAAADRLAQLREGNRYRQLPESIRERFDALIPRIVEGCAALPNPDDTLARTLNLIETISRRGAYLALLQQYPQALRRLLELASASSWAAEYLTTHPILLDELLDARPLDEAPDWPAFACHLREQLDAAEPDIERQMDLMREQHHAQVFRILHQDIAGKWEVEAIGDHLSALADVVLEETIRQCWRKIKKRHTETPQFAVIGYGKLGGKEMGYSSDLDIVFLYDDEDQSASEHYARLAQRLLTWLSSRTPAGTLFETDTRLRPNGESGLLVSSLEAFSKYQNESAWLWEHQALTRARFVAGDKRVGAAFEAAREEILRRPRDLAGLATDVIAMRRKMLDNHASRGDSFNVKDDPGGLIDFEFIIQYLVLGHAHTHPKLVANLGNIALSRICGELGLIDAARAKAAADAYRTLRRMQHRLRLNGEKARLPAGSAEAERGAISALWMDVFGRAA